MSTFPISDLPYDMQRNVILKMEPVDLAQHCKIDKEYSKICSNSFFWQSYFGSLSYDEQNEAILNIARFNQSVLKPAYKSFEKLGITLRQSTLGGLLLLSIMRNDEDMIELLTTDYNILNHTVVLKKYEVEKPDLHDADLDLIFARVNNSVTYVESSPEEYDYEKYDYINISLELFLDLPLIINLHYLVQIIEDRVGTNKLILFTTAYGVVPSVDNFTRLYVDLLSKERRIEDLKKFIAVSETSYINYLPNMADYLPIVLYETIGIPNLGAFIKTPIDEDHLREATRYNRLYFRDANGLDDYFTPVKYIEIVKTLPTKHQDYLIQMYSTTYSPIKSLWKEANENK